MRYFLSATEDESKKGESLNIEYCRRSRMSVEGWMDGHMRRRRLSYYILIVFENKKLTYYKQCKHIIYNKPTRCHSGSIVFINK